MPSLSIPNTFTPFTKILSSQVNANFSAIATLLNTTKLDNTNIQDAGLDVTKLSGTGATASYVVSWNGSVVNWAPSSLGQLYNRIVGSAADVAAGLATDDLIASAITAASAGNRILLLPSYVGTENITVSKKLYITGLGNNSVITGTVTFNSSSDYSYLTNCKVTDTITLESGADGVYVDNIWLASTKSFSIADDVTGEYVTAIQET